MASNKKSQKQTIVYSSSRHAAEYPFLALSPEVVLLFTEASLQLKRNTHFSIVLRTFECFLQITNQQVTLQTVNDPSFQKVVYDYVGAFYSDNFIDLEPTSRYQILKTFIPLLKVISYRTQAPWVIDLHLSSIGPTDEIKRHTESFESLKLDEESVWVWRGWLTVNRKGKQLWLPLYPVYQRLGRDFTQRLHEICNSYFSGRKAHYISCVKALAQFIGQYPGELNSNLLRDSSYMSKFWREFFVFYIQDGFANGNGAKVSTLVTRWNSQFVNFAAEYLFPSGLFAKPWGDLPSPDRQFVSGARTNIVLNKDGHEIKTKLLTHIPLHLTDDEAIQLLFSEIQTDVDTILNWATVEVRDIWDRRQRRLERASQGKVRVIQRPGTTEKGHKWITDRLNPEHLENAFATFDHYGFYPITKGPHRRLYPKPLWQTAYELALPTQFAIIPHCALLVAHNPAITDSFLCDLELFDKNGKQVGFVKTDGGYQLVGHKDRRGPALAQQIINLDDRDAEIVSQAIALTQPIRDYLKAQGDDNWRYLLLSCARAFSYPLRIRRLTAATSGDKWKKSFAATLAKSSELTEQQRSSMCERFSITTLRASAAVLIYLRTRSVEKMSQALGHATYKPALLSSYLPEPILAFFQDRWIRIFQEGIIIEALKDSEYLLQASSFNSMNELHEFLAKHALRPIPEYLANSGSLNGIQSAELNTARGSSAIHFGVSVGVLSLLISLQLAVAQANRKVCSKAKYWAGIGQHLIRYIETNLHDRPDIQSQLASAKKCTANPINMEALIYDDA